MYRWILTLALFCWFTPVQALGQLIPSYPIKSGSATVSKTSDAWRVKSEKLRLAEDDLKLVYFADEQTGWISDGGNLYKTINRGSTWNKIALDTPESGKIEKIQCTSLSFCWLLVQGRSTWNGKNEENFYYLYKSTDAGTTWLLNRNEIGIALNSVLFTRSGNGWLVGTASPFDYHRSRAYALVTRDNGQTWQDVGKNILDSLPDPSTPFERYANNQLIGVTALKDGSVRIATFDHRILRTMDGGIAWFGQDIKRDFQEGLNFFDFGSTNEGRLWMVGSAAREEGTGSALIIEIGENNWVRQEAGSIYLSDLISVHGDKFYACGYEETVRDNGDKKEFIKTGVVFEITNSGRVWTPIHRDPSVENIRSISLTGGKSMLAVGDKGRMFWLTRK